jgi:uncharacterized protein
VRAALLMIPLLGCSTSTKREDPPPMPSLTPDRTGSDSSSNAPPAATATVYLATPKGDIGVTVEVVATEAKIEKGLMYRRHLPPDRGMLFLMGGEKQWTFWMRNTLISLDMIFINKDMTVSGIVENAEPMTESLRKVDRVSSYVLEVNGGWSRSAGVVAGAAVRFENVPQ